MVGAGASLIRTWSVPLVEPNRYEAKFVLKRS